MLFSLAEWQCLGLWGSAREPSGGVEERLGLMVIALACEHAGGGQALLHTAFLK